MHWLSRKRNLAIMMFPTLLIYTVYIVTAMFIAIFYSFTKYSGIGKPKFLGFNNYIRVFNDRFFWISLFNTAIILVIALLFLTTLGFLLANLFRGKRRANNACKAMVFSPAIISPIIVGIIWLYILDPEIGALNALLHALGLEGWMQLWIGGTVLSPYMYAVIFFWRQLGYITTIFVAGLNMIPIEVYESAEIDGASGWARMLRITIPMMKSTFTITILLIITGVFKIFEFVVQLTNGGPNHLSEVLVTYSYNIAFSNGEYSYGMALATVTFVITLILSALYTKATTQKEGTT